VVETLSRPGERAVGAASSGPESVLEAQAIAHRAEVNKLAMQLLLYRTALEQAGIDPPDASAEDLLEMWKRCMAIVQHANEFVSGLGSAKELLEAWS
jgi:hypothetical protein